MTLFTLIDPKRRSTVPSSRNKQSVLSMIVDLSEFRDEKRPVLGEVSADQRDGGVMPVKAAGGDRHLSDSQIFDLEHHRRLKALHTHLEEGATLSEAARLIGVSQMTAYRWNDHGRR
jgi:hypothetical protein